MQEAIDIGYETFVSDGGPAFGAVRELAPNGGADIKIYIENAGDFIVPLTAVMAVRLQKVILDRDQLEPALREAIQHAHDAETRY